MDLTRKLTLCATLAAALFAVDAARGQTRPNVLTRGVGSTTAQGAERGSARGSDPIFVAPNAGVNENARGVGAYDVAPSPAAALPNAIYAEASSEASLEEEKAQAAVIMAQTKERAAARKHVVSRPINAPMTLKALKDKPQAAPSSTAQSGQNGQNTRRAANSPQYLQYSPSANAARPNYNSGWRPAQSQASAQPLPNAQSTPRPAAISQSAPALNWDGSTRKEYGRSQPPTTAAPFAYDAISTNPNDVNIDEASFAISGFEPSRSDVEPQIAQDAEDAGQASPVFDGFEQELVGVPAGETGDDDEDELPPFIAPSQEALDKIGVATDDAVESAPIPQGPAPLQSDALLDEGDDVDLEVAIPTADDLLDAATNESEIEPEIESVAVEPVAVEQIPVEPSPVEPVLVEPVAIDEPESAPNSDDPIPVEPATAEPNASLDENATQIDSTVVGEPEAPDDATTNRVESAQEEPANEEPAAPSPSAENDPQNGQNAQNDAGRAQFAYDALMYATPSITCAPELHPMANRLAPAAPNAYLSYAPACATPQAPAPRRVVGIQAPARQPGALVVSPAYEANSYVAEPGRPFAFASDCNEGATRPYGFLFGAEWLAWKTDADQPYAQKVNASGATIDERDLKADGTGLRGRVGFRGFDGWDIIGTYTWFNQNDDGSVKGDENSSLVSPKQGGEFDSISGKLKTDLQVVDVEIGRWNERGAFAFRPFLGFRWTQLNLETSDAFSALANSGDDLLDGTVSVVDGATDSEKAFSNAVADSDLIGVGALRAKSRLNAYGLRLGADVELALAQGLSIYGKGAGTLAVGDVKSTLAYVGEGGYNGEIKKTYFTPSVEGGVGLSWKVNGLDVRGGYEFNAWYNAANMNGRKSDFIAHGVVAGLGYNY